MVCHGLRQEERPLQIHAQQLFERGFAGFGEVCSYPRRDPSVVDERIDAATCVERLRQHRCAIVMLADVTTHWDEQLRGMWRYTPAQRRRFIGGSGVACVVDGHGETGSGRLEC